MNFVLIFNNNFIQNSNLINTVKRYLIYKINKSLQNNIYNKIIIIRTYHNIHLYEYDINCENLEKIIMTINNIIFKNYNDIILDKNGLINLIIKYYKLNSDIIIVNSSNNYLLFDDIGKILTGIQCDAQDSKEITSDEIKLPLNCCCFITENYEKLELIPDFGSIEETRESNMHWFPEKNKLILLINISKFRFYIKNELFNQIIIDPRALHIKDIINNELFYYFNKNIINNELNNESNNELINYLNLFEECENNCINNKKCDEQLVNKIENIKINTSCFMSTCVDDNTEVSKESKMCSIPNDKIFVDLKLNLLINSVIKNITRNQSQIIIIPTENIDKNIYDTNIKYIIEFYSIIYPRLLNNYLNSNYNNNISIKDNKINKITKLGKINELNIKKNDKIELEEDSSLNYTISNISMTNWVDEYNEYNPYGILIKYNISKNSYKGLIDEKSTIIKTFPDMIIDSISNNWISLYDYYQLIISYKNEDSYENNIDKFNLNNFKINDAIHGESNIMLPLYINKNHWNLAKSLWKYHISFINNSFESEYNKKMDNIYYLLLLKQFTNLLDKNIIPDNKIILFIHILRTTIQVSIDNKYINTISSEYSRYFNYLINLDKKFQGKNLLELNLIDYIMRYIQYCVLNNDITNLEKELSIIREIILNNYKKKILCGQNDLKSNELKDNFILDNINWLNLEITLIKFGKVINSIYKIKGFNQFIKFVDKTNSYIMGDSDNKDDITCNNIKNIINSYNNIYDIEYIKSKILI
jgi:hypothetical protein